MYFIDDDGVEKEANAQNIREKILKTLLGTAGAGNGAPATSAAATDDDSMATAVLNEEKDNSSSDEEDETPTTIQQSLTKLSKDANDYYLSRSVPERFVSPRALDFHREWIFYNRPVIFRSAASHWSALQKWQDDSYILEKLRNKQVTVTVTPNGYADSIVEDNFVMPLEEQMSFSHFLKQLNESPEQRKIRNPPSVYYIQKQNSNLTDEFSELLEDIEELSWASEAFGKEPDAINFWMGEEKAVTSTHKDPYENIYVVVRGHKDIILHPPTDLPWLPYKDCHPAIYKRSADRSEIVIEELNDLDTVSWVDIDPLKPDTAKYPEYSKANPVRCRLNAGDVLYLPSLWFHHLSQSQGCIAVNFWYDMEYNAHFNYFNFLNNITNLGKNNS